MDEPPTPHGRRTGHFIFGCGSEKAQKKPAAGGEKMPVILRRVWFGAKHASGDEGEKIKTHTQKKEGKKERKTK